MNKQHKSDYPTAKEADIALLLEGSYPFIIGGVSSWMHQIIEALPQYTFAIIFIGSSPEDYPEGMRYKLSKNVVHFEAYYIYSKKDSLHQQPKVKKNQPLNTFYLLQDLLRNKNDNENFDRFRDLNFPINAFSYKSYEDFFQSRTNWQFIVNYYFRYCTDPSFINYFWTIRHIEKPVWTLAKAAQNFIKVKAVHTISTGYAGFLGALVHIKYKYPLILTEHGIYSKERRIELLQSDTLAEADETQQFSTELSYIRNFWMRYFDLLAHICYEAANPIISLFSETQKKQIEEGAEPVKTEIIFNGINIEKFKPLRNTDKESIPPVLCMIGRIVPIKDIKTFIRAINIVAQHIPHIEGWIAGPADENAEYFEECKNLTTVLDLDKNVKFFPGKQDVPQFLSKTSLLILSSISEGMPLVVLEGFAAGVPAIVTDVGACRDLILGHSPEDKQLGTAGDVVQIANPQALANAALKLLKSPQQWKKAQQAGINRVEKYYDEKTMLKKYDSIYKLTLRKQAI